MTPSRQPVAPKYFEKGIDAQRVVGALGKQRDKIVGKSAIDIVGHDDEVTALGVDEFRQLVKARIGQFVGWRIARIDQAENLDGRVFQLS